MVSARHARLSYHHNQWWIEDFQSTNGTFLNEERIYTPTVLMKGDEIRCGKCHLEITLSEKNEGAG
jgi:pSer/pThr/pTyr-binding forkhead associated (FHA) protein